MMNNLFSVFDPSSLLFSYPWIMMATLPLFIVTKMNIVLPPLSKMLNVLLSSLKKEVSFTLNKKEKGSETLIILIFTMILLMNFIALYPQIFSPTSHLTVTLPLSVLFWTSLMMFGWTKNTNHMLSHLVPQGTPTALMMFMVLIEMVSNVIRPITLCVRLTANLIAGHLLMSLLGNAFTSMNFFMSMIMLPVPMTLTVLESAVACIQAYVFMTLITLYTTEVK